MRKTQLSREAWFVCVSTVRGARLVELGFALSKCLAWDVGSGRNAICVCAKEIHADDQSLWQWADFDSTMWLSIICTWNGFQKQVGDTVFAQLRTKVVRALCGEGWKGGQRQVGGSGTVDERASNSYSNSYRHDTLAKRPRRTMMGSAIEAAIIRAVFHNLDKLVIVSSANKGIYIIRI